MIKGAFALTLAALITKILSAVYRVPFQNIVGDVGFYIYQQVYPFYGVALAFSTYGFPVIISKLYAERKNRDDQIGLHRLLFVSAIFISLLGFTAFIILFYGAEQIAKNMNDPGLALLIKVISIAFLIIPFTSVLRGYFQGEGNMVPTAYSQVGEQLFRVGTILTAAILLMKTKGDLYVVGSGAVFSSVIGGLAAFIILVFFIWMKRKKEKTPFPKLGDLLDLRETGGLLKILFFQGFAVCISSMLLIFMQLADSLNLYSLLIANGINGEDAKELKGIYDRGQPLVQLGSVVATSMSLSLVPLISSAKIKTNASFLYEKIRLSLQISIAFGLGAAVGLVSIIKPTNIMLFKNAHGSDVLAMLSMMILLSSLIITIVAILQGLGSMVFPAVMVLLGFGFKYILNLVLVPIGGTMGAAIATNCSLLIVLGILLVRLFIIIKKRVVSFRFLAVIALAALCMFVVVKVFLFGTDFLRGFGDTRLLASLQALSAVVIGGVTYLFVVIRSKVFTMEELTLLPFGSKIMYLFPKMNRR
jgi:PST family polysaccharide transporter